MATPLPEPIVHSTSTPPIPVHKYMTHKEGITTGTLIVEGKTLFVIKELLAISSKVFEKMFANSPDGKLELTDSKYQAICLLLDYLYPMTKLEISDDVATALLPLAHEYEVEILKQSCTDVLMKLQNPRLELITLAEAYNIPRLREAATEACVTHVNSKSLEEQMGKPENKALKSPMTVVFKILRKKLERVATVKYDSTRKRL